MQRIQHLEMRETILDTGSRDLTAIDTVSVYAGDTCLINAAPLCDVLSDPCQLLICQRGIVDCNSGGYASVRRLGNDVVILPPFGNGATENPVDGCSVFPAECLMHDGGVGITFASSVYASIEGALSNRPDFKSLLPLLAKEAMRAIQMTAPLQVLGDEESIELNRDTVLAVSTGEIDAEFHAVDAFVRSMAVSNSPLIVTAQSAAFEPIEFYLDGSGLPAWCNFVRWKGDVCFNWPPFGVLIPQK